MIPADVQNSLKALALTQKQLVTATTAATATAAFEPGQRFQASVQAQLAPGIFKVQVANQTLQLQLPSNIRSGDTISLQVVSLLPKLTFNMAASANPLSTADQLSAGARLLSSLAQQPLEKGFVRSTASTPLWTGATQFPDTVELSHALKTALSQSGLFYEAHQAQWIAGSRNRTQLMQEPQNLTPDRARAALGLNEVTHQNSAESIQPRTTIAGIPEHLLPLVQQQLHALETRQVHWQGNIWQDQSMDWEIGEEDTKSADAEEGRHWMTQIHLNLPNLGEISATLRFGNNGVTLTLEADDTKTRNKFGTATSQLITSMTERGINVSSAVVKQYDVA